MSQNTTHAVMQQRQPTTDLLDDYPTPPWALRALMEHVIKPNMGLTAHLRLKQMTCWEPACNRGYMVLALSEYFGRVISTDIFDYGSGGAVHDFLLPYLPLNGTLAIEGCDWIITNPPFRLAEQFIERARNIKGWQGTAMLVRSAFLEGVGRYERLFKPTPPTLIAQFVERVPMVKGRLSAESVTATSYTWLVWMKGFSPRPLIWIPPCRKTLERPGDYPQLPAIGGESHGTRQESFTGCQQRSQIE